MKKLFITPLLFFIICFWSYGQVQVLQNNNWALPNGGLTFNGSTTATPTNLPFPSAALTLATPDFGEGNASVSDLNGNLLLYSDGVRLWRRDWITGTTSLITSSLLGSNTSSQNVIIVPKPSYPNHYYIITICGSTTGLCATSTDVHRYCGTEVGKYPSGKGLYYSEVDYLTGTLLSINTPLKSNAYFDPNLGGGTYMPAVSIDATFHNTGEALTAALDFDGKDYWVIAQVENETRGGFVLSYKIDCNGFPSGNIPTNATSLTIHSGTGNGFAAMVKISPNGQKIGITSDNGTYVGDFNSTAGTVSGLTLIPNSYSSYGIEFSPNSANIYFTDYNYGVYGYQLTDLNNSFFSGNQLDDGLQLGIDGKIYSGNSEFVINDPNNSANPAYQFLGTINNPTTDLPQWVPWQTDPSHGSIVATDNDFIINTCTTNNTASIPLTGHHLSMVGAVTPIPTSGGISLNTSTGVITVQQGTAVGTYVIKYQLCATNSCPDCSNVGTITLHVVTTAVTPTFTQVPPICAGDTLAPLPTTSTNGVTGSWSPGINNMNTTTYTFTPTAAACGPQVTMTIVVNPKITPTFIPIAPICYGDNLNPLPTISTNGIPGTWAPSLSNTVSHIYTFTPTIGQCAFTATLAITVNAKITPTFTPVAPICYGGTLSSLPTTSNNGITGAWSPQLSNTISTIYTFTPTPGQCANPTTLSIIVNQKGDPHFSFNTTICSLDTPFVLPLTSNEGYTGTWSPSTVDHTGCYTFTPNTGVCAHSVQVCITIQTASTPLFNFFTTICSDNLPFNLPLIDQNGITGSWNPSSVTPEVSSYTFTPDPGQCATSIKVDIKIVPAVTPVFSFPTVICKGDAYPILPSHPDNTEEPGVWTPDVVQGPGTYHFVFSNITGPCVHDYYAEIIEVDPPIVPTFANLGSPLVLCHESIIPLLPTVSLEGVQGTWNPSAIDIHQSRSYCFTPAKGFCAKKVCIDVIIKDDCPPVKIPKISCFGFDPTYNVNDLNENYGFVTFSGGPAATAGLTFHWYFRFLDQSLQEFYVQNPTFDVFCPKNPVMCFGVEISNGLVMQKLYSPSANLPYYIPGFGGAASKTCFTHVVCDEERGTYKNDAVVPARITVYPNPTTTVLQFSGASLNKYSITIYDLLGNEIMKKIGLEHEINLERFSSGLYLYKITGDKNFVQDGKILKE